MRAMSRKIGHGPWTATPVLYATRTNADGLACWAEGRLDAAKERIGLAAHSPLWRAAARAAARKALSCPENLGVGKPYDLDFRPGTGERNPLSDWSEDLRKLAAE